MPDVERVRERERKRERNIRETERKRDREKERERERETGGRYIYDGGCDDITLWRREQTGQIFAPSCRDTLVLISQTFSSTPQHARKADFVIH